jgi:hypothetical protein
VQNLNLRHIYITHLFDFWRRFLRNWLQSLKKVLIGQKNINIKKVSKNEEFHVDFKSVEKVLKIAPKKS